MAGRQLQLAARLLQQVQGCTRTFHCGVVSSEKSPLPGSPSAQSLREAADEAISEQQQGIQQQQRRGNAALAQVATHTSTFTMPSISVPAVRVDLSGAISVVPEGELIQEGIYKNQARR